MLGPSLKAASGLGWVSMNKPSAPAATAQRASTGANCRWPADLSPPPPGSCTECVASKITGKPNCRRIGIERMSATRLL
jgi:hypothetical protein